MNLIEHIHTGYIHRRRTQVLSQHLSALIPHCARVLDVGCGDGLLSSQISETRPDVQIMGLDVFIRSQHYIAVAQFDGYTIPHNNSTFDVVMLVDVLHHTQDPMILLHEAARVTRNVIVIKDHLSDGILAGPTLRLMDRIGNARHGVTLPYNHWPQNRWFEAFQQLGLTAAVWKKDLKLYPRLLDVAFGRSLHFIARLDLKLNL